MDCAQDSPTITKCQITNCNRPIKCNGRCARHYKKPKVDPNKIIICTITGCEYKAHENTFCRNHNDMYNVFNGTDAAYDVIQHRIWGLGEHLKSIELKPKNKADVLYDLTSGTNPMLNYIDKSFHAIFGIPKPCTVRNLLQGL